MTMFQWLRKLGILRFGAEAGVYRNAAERPLSFQDDNFYGCEKDVIRLGKKAGQEIGRESREPQET